MGMVICVHNLLSRAPGWRPGWLIISRQRLSFLTFRSASKSRSLPIAQIAILGLLLFLADLHSILERFGNRGYRAVQLEAGILGGKLYLAAYAQRLGATGLTFYDDDVVEFFSPHAQGKSAIFLMALGHGQKRPVLG